MLLGGKSHLMLQTSIIIFVPSGGETGRCNHGLITAKSFRVWEELWEVWTNMSVTRNDTMLKYEQQQWVRTRGEAHARAVEAAAHSAQSLPNGRALDTNGTNGWTRTREHCGRSHCRGTAD